MISMSQAFIDNNTTYFKIWLAKTFYYFFLVYRRTSADIANTVTYTR